jgi:hypothetical protein
MRCKGGPRKRGLNQRQAQNIQKSIPLSLSFTLICQWEAGPAEKRALAAKKAKLAAAEIRKLSERVSGRPVSVRACALNRRDLCRLSSLTGWQGFERHCSVPAILNGAVFGRGLRYSSSVTSSKNILKISRENGGV